MSAQLERLLVFLPSLAAGGAERVTVNLVNELSRHVPEVYLIVGTDKLELADGLSPNVKSIFLRKTRILFCIYDLVRYIYSIKPQVVLSALDNGNFAAIFCRLVLLPIFRFRLLVTEHSTPSRAVISNIKDRLVSIFKGRAYNVADGVVCVSSGVKADLQGHFAVTAEKLHVIANPVVTPQMCEELESLAAGVGSVCINGDYIVGVGRLVYNKDFANLIRAFHLSNCRFTHKLVVIGDGPDRADLENLVTDLGLEGCVLFLGYVPNPLPYLYFAKLFVLSSRFEGLPTVLIEALACGTPVVSTDCQSGPSEILESGKWGELCPIEQPELLAILMDRALMSPERINTDEIKVRYSSFCAAQSYKILAESII